MVFQAFLDRAKMGYFCMGWTADLTLGHFSSISALDGGGPPT